MAVPPVSTVEICGISGCTRVAVGALSIFYPRTGTLMDRPRCAGHKTSQSALATTQGLLVGANVTWKCYAPQASIVRRSA